MLNPTIINQTDTSINAGCKRAVVLGAGIAGLLAARALANWFDHVIVIERDRFPDHPAPRSGVPQSYQLHVLITQGQRIVEQLFPGFRDQLAEQGAPLIDWAADCPLLLPQGWSPRFKSDLTTYASSRNLLESLLRQQLTQYKAIEFLTETQVTGLFTNPDHTAVLGVQTRDHQNHQRSILAQIVVDASGRNSKTPQWLQQMGYGMPQQEVVNSFLGYASRLYGGWNDQAVPYKALYIMPKAPDYPRGGVMYQIEHGQWMVVCIGVGRDYPPTDEAGFLQFAQSLRSPEIYEAIRQAEPISPIYGYRRTENCWRHYEHLSSFPKNFVVLGDAVCAFNPVYGQGMTVAALGALQLDRWLQQHQHSLEQGKSGLTRQFQQQLAQVIQTPWLIATGDDFRWATTEGKAPKGVTKVIHRYLDQVIQAASQDPEVYAAFISVIHMVKPPTLFLHPRIVRSVLRSGWSWSQRRSLESQGISMRG
ncbi:MAG TPA: FAD-dependent oxidoreductase [Allocoleopsis sp.]